MKSMKIVKKRNLGLFGWWLIVIAISFAA